MHWSGCALATMLGGQSGGHTKKAQNEMDTICPLFSGQEKLEKWKNAQSVLPRFPLWVSVVRTWLEPYEHQTAF